MKITSRLQQFIEYKRISLNAFDKSIGASNGYIGRQIKNQASIGGDILEKISCINPELDMNWLITGKGSMLKGDSANKQTLESSSPSITLVKENIEPYQKKQEGQFSSNELLDRIERLVEEKAELKARIVELEKVKKQAQPITYGAAVEPIPQLEKGHKHK